MAMNGQTPSGLAGSARLPLHYTKNSAPSLLTFPDPVLYW